MSLSSVGLSKVTALLALSLTFPLDHFFFFAFPPPEVGLVAFCVFGGYLQLARALAVIRAMQKHHGEENQMEITVGCLQRRNGTDSIKNETP
jgi:hypothetical protein